MYGPRISCNCKIALTISTRLYTLSYPFACCCFMSVIHVVIYASPAQFGRKLSRLLPLIFAAFAQREVTLRSYEERQQGNPSLTIRIPDYSALISSTPMFLSSAFSSSPFSPFPVPKPVIPHGIGVLPSEKNCNRLCSKLRSNAFLFTEHCF